MSCNTRVLNFKTLTCFVCVQVFIIANNANNNNLSYQNELNFIIKICVNV